jgi:Ca-activated chloride channel family protein
MTFLAPHWLWLLAACVALIGAYVVLQRRGRHKAVRHPDLALVTSVAPRHAGWRRHVTAAAVVLAVTGLVVGLARPARTEAVPRDEAVVVLAIDISKSMSATDIAPNRLAAAVAAAKHFVDGAPESYRIGLVTFDTKGHTVTTPTTDHTAVTEALDTLKPYKGTAAGDGLATAVDLVKAANGSSASASTSDKPYSAVVLLTDGDSTVGQPLSQAAAKAKKAEVPVFTIAYGTDHGTAVINGSSTSVPVDRAALQRVAETTGGTAYTATTADQLTRIYDRIGVRVGTTTDQVEYTLPLAAIAAALLACALIGTAVWSPRLV